MLYHVRVDTHKFDWLDLYLEHPPTKDDLLQIADSIIRQYENGKTQAKNQYGYSWDWNKGISQWRRAHKILNYPTQKEYDDTVGCLMNLISANYTELVNYVKLYSQFSNGYNIHFTAVNPLADINDPRLSNTIVRTK